MRSVDHPQAITGALFCFGAGLVLSGFNPFPLALAAGVAATISSISSDILSKVGKEKKLGLTTDILLIAAASATLFTFSGILFFLPFEGIAGMAFSGFVFSSWLIIRKWAELIDNY